jgi:hypothetical protein
MQKIHWAECDKCEKESRKLRACKEGYGEIQWLCPVCFHELFPSVADKVYTPKVSEGAS